MQEEAHSRNHQGSHLFEIVGASYGAALGWVLSPAEYHRLGLGIGAGVGVLLGSVWEWWWRRRKPAIEPVLPVGVVGYTFYIFAIGLCIWMLWLTGKTWICFLERWFAALTSFLFFGAGIGVLFLLWKFDSLSAISQSLEAKRDRALGLCSFMLALVSLFLIFLGNISIGVIGTLFFFGCGAVLLRKHSSSKLRRRLD